MAKVQTTTYKVKLGKAAERYIDALGQLFEMVGGSLKFKRVVATLKEEIETKVYTESGAIRDVIGELKAAIAERDKEASAQKLPPTNTDKVLAARDKYEKVRAEVYEKEIELKSPKILVSDLPDEETLTHQYSFPYFDPVTGQQAHKHGDYVTLVAAIWSDLIEENNGN